MDTTTTARLARIRRYATLYEVAGMTPDGRTVLIMYSGKSMSRVAAGVRARYDRLAPIMGTEISLARDVESRGGPGCVWLTGRTEREAICEGELPYVFDAALAA